MLLWAACLVREQTQPRPPPVWFERENEEKKERKKKSYTPRSLGWTLDGVRRLRCASLQAWPLAAVRCRGAAARINPCEQQIAQTKRELAPGWLGAGAAWADLRKSRRQSSAIER